MRKPFICGNWKLNKTIEESVKFIKELRELVTNVNTVDIGIGAQFCALNSLSNEAKNTNILIGAQDVYWQESGAFTGEVSSTILKDAGCSFVIIGHSERRQFFNETNETVNQKIKAALAQKLDVIMCVGESEKERRENKTNAVVEDHVRNGLAGITSEQMKKITIAYEPVWAIGTGLVATPEQAQEVHAYIRKLLTDLFGKETAEQVRIQYGGSVKPDNVKTLMACPDVDGALVGGASLKVADFEKLIKFEQ